MLHLDEQIKTEIINIALAHIKKVEANPEVKTDGDNFDYWNSYELKDGSFVDYNIYESNFGVEYEDFDGYEWHCSVFAVDPPSRTNPYHQINTSKEQYLLYYSKDSIVLQN